MSEVRLKRLFQTVSGGSWGVEPEVGEVTLPCVRGTDFNYRALRSAIGTAPVRGFSRHEVDIRAAQRGDLIIEKSGGGEKQPVGRVVLHDSDDVVMPTNFASRLTPSVANEPRFLTYLMASLYIGGTTTASIKQTTGIQNLDLQAFLDTSVFRPSLSKQRAIADFLDAETARIDALIEKKRRLVVLLREQLASHIERAVWTRVHGTIPLMYLTPPHRQIMYGIVLPGPNVEDGVLIIKGGNVASGKLEPSQLAKTTCDIEANYVRSRIAGGDVLYAIRGGIGDVAIASPSIAGANITQDVARVAPRVDVDPRWIRYALESATTRADALGRVVGATVKGINIWDLKRVRVPNIDPAEMQSRADELSEIERSINEIQQRLNHQIELLTEHRQALITAAVAGQLEVANATG